MANFYTSNNVINAGVRWELLTSGEGNSSVSMSASKTATTSFYFRTLADVPNNADWETGAFTVYITIDTGFTEDFMDVRINRCNSGGTIQESSAYAGEQASTAGSKTFSIASKDWAAGNASDLLELQINIRVPGHSNRVYVISTGDTGDYLSSSITITVGASPITGTVTAAASVSGAMQAKGELVGTVTSAAIVSGAMQATGILTGSSVGVVTVSSLIVATGILIGASAGAVVVSGAIVATGTLSGSSIGAVIVTGVMVQPAGDISGTISAAAIVLGNLDARGALIGTVTIDTITGSALTGTGILVGYCVGASVVGGALTGTGNITVSIVGAAITGGVLTGTGNIVGSVIGAVVTGGVLTEILENALTGTVAAITLVGGVLTGTGNITVSVTGSAIVLGALIGRAPITGSVAGVTITGGVLTGVSENALTGTVIVITNVSAKLKKVGGKPVARIKRIMNYYYQPAHPAFKRI